MTAPVDLEARVATLEAQIGALTAAVTNVRALASGEQLRAAILAGLEQQQIPVDATGQRFHDAAEYASLDKWRGTDTAANEGVPILRASHSAVLHNPGLHVRTTTAKADVRRLRAERGLA